MQIVTGHHSSRSTCCRGPAEAARPDVFALMPSVLLDARPYAYLWGLARSHGLGGVEDSPMIS